MGVSLHTFSLHTQFKFRPFVGPEENQLQKIISQQDTQLAPFDVPEP